MKKFTLMLIALACFVFLSEQLHAAEKYKYNITLKNSNGKVFKKLFLGIGKNATDSLDENYGEARIPNIGLPATVFAGNFILSKDFTGEDIWSYQDIRDYPNGIAPFKKEYKFQVYKQDHELLTLSMSSLPLIMDSITIQEDLYDGKYFKKTITTHDDLVVENKALKKFKVIVWYNPTKISVEDESVDNMITVFPVPCDDKLFFKNIIPTSIVIYDLNGSEVLSIDNASIDAIDVSNLERGIYYCEMTSAGNKRIIKKVIKR